MTSSKEKELLAHDRKEKEPEDVPKYEAVASGAGPSSWAPELITASSKNPFYPAASSSATAGPAGPAASGPSDAPPLYTPITAAGFVQRLDPGWNLGNTLDAVPDEGSWNNRPVVASTFDAVKRAGFRSVRIPVTYADHYISAGPDWTIDPKWLARIEEVIRMALLEGFYVITNVHHDSTKWADLTKHKPQAVYEQFYATWVQIAAALKHFPETVAFESINEPPADNATDGANVNEFNRLFLDAINAADPRDNGYNPQRVVNLVGGMQDPKKTVDWFVPPRNLAQYSNPWALQFHYYWPYNYIFSAWGKTTWGSDDEKKTVEADLEMVRNKFPTIPLVLGEFSASPINCERGARWRYLDFMLRTARALDMAPMMWDNGLDNFDRGPQVWRDPTSLQIILDAGRVSGENSLPGGTVNERAAEQESSAFIYHKVGDAVKYRTIPFLLNGNKIRRVENAGSPVGPAGHQINGNKITFSENLLKKHFVGEPGSKGVFTVVFSGGIALPVELILWDTPVLAIKSYDPAFYDEDLKIPVKYKGIATVAAVRIMLVPSDGRAEPYGPAFDEWTKHLGPLQEGRATFEKQWNFDESNVIITSAALKYIAESGQNAEVTFEFYPRVFNNTVYFSLAGRKPLPKEPPKEPAVDRQQLTYEEPDKKAGCCVLS
ncbi:endoglucanase d precursor [Ophiostoma piceae UAMH 11346]|uniref:Endoglucanase d n=1 Tax=Ophiostoma piceae (strain UAMH 11346) TaxID=1262450 RepID=S3BQE7_OPHP1|nr:endoglucanase d precursor [Ophiostoma piceae UAMH 11346]